MEKTKLIIDSEHIYKEIMKEFSPDKVELYTSSPYMLENFGAEFKGLENKWTTEQLMELQKSTLAFTEDIFKTFKENGIEEYALIAIIRVVRLNLMILRAGSLPSSFATSDVISTNVKMTYPLEDEIINTRWDMALSKNQNHKILKYDYRKLYPEKKKKENEKSFKLFIRKMLLGGTETLVYRLLLKFHKFLTFIPTRGTVFINKENEILIEAASAFALRGFKIKQIKHQKIEINESYFNKTVKDVLSKLSRQRISRWVEEPFIDGSVDYYVDMVINDIKIYEAYKVYWFNLLKDDLSKKKNFIFCNSPLSPISQALASTSRKLGIPLVTGQCPD